MNRNVESNFAYNPADVDMPRSKFDRSHTVKTSFNAGKLVPFFWDEILPGDTVQIKTSFVARMQPLVTPIMDDIYLDYYYFFVPARLTWNHWKEFNGENTQGAWIPETTYRVPQLKLANPVEVGSVADYMGIPPRAEAYGTSSQVQALPFRAYALIFNEWFRDENLMNPTYVYLGDADDHNVAVADGWLTGAALGGELCPVAKYADYFTTALPGPQKGESVEIPIIGDIPVVTRMNLHSNSFTQVTPGSDSMQAPGVAYWKLGAVGSNNQGNVYKEWYSWNTDATFGSVGTANVVGRKTSDNMTIASYNSFPANSMSPANLWADASSALAVTINQLRIAFQLQKFYEKAARGGSRYIETLKVMFGVTSPDARLQRPEYLGGSRVPIDVRQIVQQSETAATPQGTPTGLSVTGSSNGDFIHSFTEHGFLIGVACARYNHTYQQGVNRQFFRRTMFDYYWPVFANIGEQPILNREIYFTGTVQDDEVFGYQEAWAEYRYKPDSVSGEMRSGVANSLDVWHLGDNYSGMPMLSQEWIAEDASNIDRVLSVTSALSHQFFADVRVDNEITRIMPLYSIPGLVDHH